MTGATTAVRQNPYLGIGLYTVPDAARLLRTSSSSTRRWAKGYTFQRDGASRHSPPVFHRDHQDLAGGNILTFADVVELKLIALFRSQGVSLAEIRRVAGFIAAHYGVNHPLAFQQFHTDGRRLFAEWVNTATTKEDRTHRLQELPTFQLVLEEVAQPFFKRLDYEQELAQRLWPLGRTHRIVIDPARSFGSPIDDETGVPTYPLYAMVSGGTRSERVAEWYQVPLAAVEAACEFEQWLRAA